MSVPIVICAPTLLRGAQTKPRLRSSAIILLDIVRFRNDHKMQKPHKEHPQGIDIVVFGTPHPVRYLFTESR